MLVATHANGTIDFGDTKIEFILGPLLPAGPVGQNVLPWYDANQEARYAIRRNIPSVAPRAVETGTLSVTNGSPNITGSGTRFTKDVATASPSGATISLYILGVVALIFVFCA